MASPPLQIDLPAAFLPLFQPARIKTFYGGRGSGKSWQFASALVVLAYASPKRILCCREFQSSIRDSVHKLLSDRIEAMGLMRWFDIQRDTIRSHNGSEFLFKGIRHDPQGIKSTEGIDIAWVEEAQSVSAESWQTLTPTIRKSGSEIWVSFNPVNETDSTWQRMVVEGKSHPRGAIVRHVGWQDNPWFPGSEMDADRQHMLATDPDSYEHVWEGGFLQISDAQIFRGRVRVETFETPKDTRFFFGADWGFSQDPTTMVRCWISDDTLFIDEEVYSIGCELDETAALFDRVPDSRDWPIKADNSRPETISYVGRQGFNIEAAAKWPGSVEDGVAHLKAFKAIVVHERCAHTAQEFRLYSYKVDRRNGDVLPVIEDKNNHMIDAIRYSLDGYIQSRGGLGSWQRAYDD